MGLNRRMPPALTFHVGAPQSLARKAQILEAIEKAIPDLVEQAKNDQSTYIVGGITNYYLDGIIDQLNDIQEFIRLNS